MAKTHPNIFMGDILRFHFKTGNTLDLAVFFKRNPNGDALCEFLLVNLGSFIVYRTFPTRIANTGELKTYHNNHLGDNSPVIDITVVGKLNTPTCGPIEKLEKLIGEEKQIAKKLAPDAIIHEYIPLLEDALSALETTRRKRILTGLGLLNKDKKA